MIEIEKLTDYTQVVIRRLWTIESFNERTGNNCKEFRPNRLNNEVI